MKVSSHQARGAAEPTGAAGAGGCAQGRDLRRVLGALDCRNSQGDFGGGGNGVIVGTVLVAKIYPDPGHHTDADLLPTLGSPTINWNGGGGNSILYDHCWVDPIMSNVPIDSPVSLRPLKTLSFRNLEY